MNLPACGKDAIPLFSKGLMHFMKPTRFLQLVLSASLFGFLAGCGSIPESSLTPSARPRISVLGDSYSTYRGSIPKENATYYPQKAGNDVREREQCWWDIVASNLNGTIECNESWSGSTICNTGYKGRNASSWSFIARTDRLGDPTHILVCGGTNDSWAGSPIGDYKWSDWTAEELAAFRPAMARMLADILAKYPAAEVYFILNSELKKEINDSVHAICAHYKVPCIDLHDIEKQGGHPSVKGMRAFADQVTAAIRETEGL